MHYETKDFHTEIKDVNVKQGIVEGYFAAFDNMDSDGDVIRQGAFEKTIQENGPQSQQPRIMHLLQHSPWEPLGKPKELNEDDFGLHFVTEIVKTSYGLDTLKLYDAGVYNEHSIGFKTIQQADREEYRELIEIKLWEGSTVTWGANENTPTTNVKTKDISEQELQEVIQQVEKLTKANRNGTFTDETFHLLDIQLNQLKQFILDHLSPAQETEPEQSTLELDRPEVWKELFAQATHTKKEFQFTWE